MHGCAGGSTAQSTESKSAVGPERPEGKHNGRGSQAGKPRPKDEAGGCVFFYETLLPKNHTIGLRRGTPRTSRGGNKRRKQSAPIKKNTSAARRGHGSAGVRPPGSSETKSDVGSGKPTAKHNGRGAQAREASPKVEAGCFDFCIKRRCQFFSTSACVGVCPGRTGVAISERGRTRQLRKNTKLRPHCISLTPQTGSGRSHSPNGSPPDTCVAQATLVC